MKTLQKSLCAQTWILALALVAFFALTPSRAHAQYSGFYVDQCANEIVDWDNNVEENVCVYGDDSGMTAYIEADIFNGQGQYVGYVADLAVQGDLQGGSGNWTNNTINYLNPQWTPSYITQTFTPGTPDTYTLTGYYTECYDSQGTDGNEYPCYWQSEQVGPQVSAQLLAGTPGYINPKYIVVGVTYAPPGSSSTVQYTNTTSVGSTTTISNSFTSDLGYSVSVKGGLGVPGASVAPAGAGVDLTFSESTDYTQGSNSSTTNTISKSSTISYITPGTPTFSPVNSDYDYIWIWVNPEVLVSIIPSDGTNPAQVEFTGYAMDENDPFTGAPPPSGPYIAGPDVVEVQVGCLNGDFSCPSTLVLSSGVVTSGTLARSWANGLYTWPSGEGPALTTNDICQILAMDPLATVSTSMCPNYTAYTQLSSLPSTTADGRFTKEGYPPNPIQYPVGAATEQYNTVQTNTESVANGTTHSVKQAFGASQTFGSNFFDIFSSTTTMTESLTLTWNYSYLDTLTNTTTLTDALSVKGPPDPPPTYTGPTEFLAYQDNLFGTFAFVP